MTNPVFSISFSDLISEAYKILASIRPWFILPMGFLFGIRVIVYLYDQITGRNEEDEFNDEINDDDVLGDEDDEWDEDQEDDLEQPIPGFVFCTYCGTKVLPHHVYCQGCGAPVTKNSYA